MTTHPLRTYKVSGRFQKFPLPLQLKGIGRFNNRCLPIAKQAMALSGKSRYLPFGIAFALRKMNDVFKIFLIPPFEFSINANIVRHNIVI